MNGISGRDVCREYLLLQLFSEFVCPHSTHALLCLHYLQERPYVPEYDGEEEIEDADAVAVRCCHACEFVIVYPVARLYPPACVVVTAYVENRTFTLLNTDGN